MEGERRNKRRRRNEVDKVVESQKELLEKGSGYLTPRALRYRLTPPFRWVVCESCGGSGWIVVDDRGNDLAVECVKCKGGRLTRER